LPDDFLAIQYLTINNIPIVNNGHRIYYKIMGNKLLTNLPAPHYIYYTKNIRDVASFSEEFKFLLSYYLAFVISSKVGAEKYKNIVYTEYMRLKADAVFNNGLEVPSLRLEDSEWLEAYCRYR
jgi:hypothetical protein